MNRDKLEILRKAWHLLFGVALVSVYQLDVISKNNILLVLLVSFFVVFSLELIRSQVKTVNRICVKLMQPIMRKTEVSGISGMPFYLLGCFVSIYFFTKNVAILSILFLAVGDPFASFVGKKLGKFSFKFNSGKSLIGFLACFAICATITYYYLRFSQYQHNLLILSLIGGITGAMAELMSVVDDNLFIPICSGLVFSLFIK